MVIHYLWIKDFLSLKEKGVNFSSKYFITFETTSVDLNVTGTLRIKHNPNYIPNFFDKPNVKEVTAIIGKNGSGKSTILEYIKSNFPEGLEANVASELVVYSLFNEEGKEVNFTIMFPLGWTVEVKDETELFDDIPYSNISDLGDAFRFASDLGDADYIFYSYNLHYNQDITDWHGLKNISTSALLVEERKRAAEERWKGDSTIEPADAFTNDLQFFTCDEIGKALQLLISEFRKDIPFTPPQSLTLTISKIDRTYFKKHDQFNNDVLEIITQLEKIRDTESSDFTKASLNDIYIATILNFFVTERKYSSNRPFTNNTKPNIGESIRDFVLRFFEQIGFTRHPDIILSEDVPRFFDLIEQMIQTRLLIPGTVNKGGDYYYNLQIREESTKAFGQFFKLYMRVKGLTNFFNFNWRNLSTGEQSYLSFMARFHHIKRHAIGYDDLKPNLVIMIDEGDVGYHPEWQRTFFKKTLDFLSALFVDHNLQLIFTANAPFITSDMPKSNVIFMEKKQDGAVIIHDKENSQSETFGSNIHTLYSNSFYMEGALIGEFAKNKIDKIIGFLNNENNTEPNQEYKKTIEVIGEPILRRKLQSMWNEKFGLSEELQTLKNRIAEIEKQQQKKKDDKSSS